MGEDATLLEKTRMRKTQCVTYANAKDATCHRRNISRLSKCKALAKYKKLKTLLTHSPHHHNPFPSLTPTTSHLPPPTSLTSQTERATFVTLAMPRPLRAGGQPLLYVNGGNWGMGEKSLAFFVARSPPLFPLPSPPPVVPLPSSPLASSPSPRPPPLVLLP